MYECLDKMCVCVHACACVCVCVCVEAQPNLICVAIISRPPAGELQRLSGEVPTLRQSAGRAGRRWTAGIYR